MVRIQDRYEYRQLERVETPGESRFLTFSCYRQLPLFSNDAINDAFARRLGQLRDRLGFKLHAWVIMPEHAHLLLTPGPEQTVRGILTRLKGPFAQRLIKRWTELNASVLERIRDPSGRMCFWRAAGGFDRNIWSAEEYCEKLHYIHVNPVRRGLVRSSTDWAWSSARWYAGLREGAIAIDRAGE